MLSFGWLCVFVPHFFPEFLMRLKLGLVQRIVDHARPVVELDIVLWLLVVARQSARQKHPASVLCIFTHPPTCIEILEPFVQSDFDRQRLRLLFIRFEHPLLRSKSFIDHAVFCFFFLKLLRPS